MLRSAGRRLRFRGGACWGGVLGRSVCVWGLAAQRGSRSVVGYGLGGPLRELRAFRRVGRGCQGGVRAWAVPSEAPRKIRGAYIITWAHRQSIDSVTLQSQALRQCRCWLHRELLESRPRAKKQNKQRTLASSHP